VGCSHAAGCPLFPLLNLSLQSWRDYYCDSEDRWRDCARYKSSLTGERVPISLLPNGHRVHHLRTADADPPHEADPMQVPRSLRQAPLAQPDPSSPETTPFEAAPARHHQPAPPTQGPQPPDSLTRHARHAPSSKRDWRDRLVDWLKGPA
jgi:hypothetical protein